MQSSSWNLASSIPEILVENAGYDSDHATFYAHYLGYCPRQVYLSKLGLRDTTDWAGRFKASQALHEFVVEKLVDAKPGLRVNERAAYDTGTIRFIGRCTAIDPEHEIAYHLKPRNGWYRFHPPVERHITQLHTYMKLFEVDRGQLIYVSLADFTDLRTWPPQSDDATFEEFQSDRFQYVVRKAEAVHRELVRNGIATSPKEIPFDKCGCYLCESESLNLPSFERTSPVERSNGLDNVHTERPVPDHDEERTEQGIDAERADSIEAIQVPGFDDIETTELTVDTKHIPNELQEFEIWVVWNKREKIALAPWQTGTMYPCQWAEDSGFDPRRDFETAEMVAEMPVDQIHDSWPFPDNDLPETVEPAVLLPHDPPDPPILFIDFDNVRNPDSEQLTTEVVDLLDQLGGYAEVSRSGKGIHTYCRGELPETESPFTSPLSDRGRIEIYECSRFTGGTWRHLEGTPLDKVPCVQPVINGIIETYGENTPAGDVNGGIRVAVGEQR